MKTKSFWGKTPKRLYRLIKIAENTFKKDFSSCIVGCSDGKFLIPFARKKHRVTGYDVDKIALYGGEKEFPLIREKNSVPFSEMNKSAVLKSEKKIVSGIKDRIKKRGIGAILFN